MRHASSVGRKTHIIVMFASILTCSATMYTMAAAASVLYQSIIPSAFTSEVKLDLSGDALDNSFIVFPADDIRCGIWLAPSTIEGAGVGMFAGDDFSAGQELLVGGDSVVAISDIGNHNGNQEFGAFLWDEYTWSASALKMSSEGYFDVKVASEGFGSAANCVLSIHNVKEWYPVLTDTGLHRATDPGAGASTLYHSRKSTAKRHIGAGSELFVFCTYRIIECF